MIAGLMSAAEAEADIIAVRAAAPSSFLIMVFSLFLTIWSTYQTFSRHGRPGAVAPQLPCA
jgi:hypothetical protein